MNDDGSYYYNTLKSTGSDICDGKWHHVAAVRSGSTGSIYLDGVSLSTTRLGNKNPFLECELGSIGLPSGRWTRRRELPPSFLTGYLAEARIWKVVRTYWQTRGFTRIFHRRLEPGRDGFQKPGWILIGPVKFGLAVDFSLLALILCRFSRLA